MFFDKWLVGPERKIWFILIFYFALFVGALKILFGWILPLMLSCLTHCCCRGRQNLKKKYGREDGSTYAVVTGGSDGIGLELCNQLAEHGFNICMISRNKDKIDLKIAEVAKKYPNIQTIGLQCDFSKLQSLAEYRDFVSTSGLDKLDIGVLCLNAGVGFMGPIDLIKDDKFEAIWTVNGLHIVYLLKALVNQLMDRDTRAAILISSSIAADCVMGGLASYSAVKTGISNWGESLHFELK